MQKVPLYRNPLVIFLIVLFVVSFVAAVYMDYQYQNLQTRYKEDIQETDEQDTELLLAMMTKLADVSREKYLKTNVEAFSLMYKLFSDLAKIRKVEEHRRKLCQEPGTKSIFTVTPNIQRSYDSVCSLYDELVKSRLVGIAKMSAYQTVLNKLVIALVKLANTISSDP